MYLSNIVISILLLFSFVVESKVIYQHTSLKDPFGHLIVKLKIDGEIVNGDYKVFRDAIVEINQQNYRVEEDTVFLNSIGGAINEATKIGHEIRKNHLATKVEKNHTCRSACTFLLVAGTCRMALGEVGLHRGRISENYASKEIMNHMLDFNSKYFDNYLKEMDAPQEFIDLTHNIPNWDMYKLSHREKTKFGLFYITTKESNYRQEIAARKLNIPKDNLVNNLVRSRSIFSFADKPSCSKQFFMDKLEQNINHLSDEFTDDNFEIYTTRQFYIHSKNGVPVMQGDRIKEHWTNRIPLEKDVVYVWEINHLSKGEKVEYKEVTTLSKPTQWTFDNLDKNTQISISKDQKQATKKVIVENTGLIIDGWGLDPKLDTRGPVKIEVFVNNKLVQTFNYEIY